MKMIDWIKFGEVSAERDNRLSDYFFDNGVLSEVIDNDLLFLVLGRKGAGKTAVFTRFDEDYHKYLRKNDAALALNLHNYDWKIHELLSSDRKAASLAYTESWKFIIFVEALYVIEYLKLESKHSKKLSKIIRAIYGTKAPSIASVLGDKLLGLSKMRLPSGSLSLDDGDVEKIAAETGSVEFSEFSMSGLLKQTLAQNIEKLVPILEKGLKNHFSSRDERIFVSFDRLDEAWLVDSRPSVRPMISGLISACENITQVFSGTLRPVVFLREDIFSDLDLNDKNKLRADCGNILGWKHEDLNRMVMQRVNFFADEANVPPLSHVNDLFDRFEMRQRRKPFDYLLLRTMMRPRDLIRFLNLVAEDIRSRRENPFDDDEVNGSHLECKAIYNAEPEYSAWLVNEILDEWQVQYPALPKLLDCFRKMGKTIFTPSEMSKSLRKLGVPAGKVDVTEYLRFLYMNSIIGFKVGQSKQWRFRCFFPTNGFTEVERYKIHDGLVTALNLKEPRAG